MIDIRQLQKEYIKCYKDKSRIYMIQNYLKTYDATQGMEVPFKLFPRQQDLCLSLAGGNNVVTTKPRQAGITTTAGAFISCEMCLADKEKPQTVLCIGNTLDLSQLFLFKVRDFLLQFPLWMWGDEYFDKGYDVTLPPENKNIIFSKCNDKELVLKNGCKVVARSSGPNASRGVGGVTFLIFDEAAFIENGKDVYASAIPTVSTGGHVIMISTPNGKDQLYYETCRRAKLKGTSDWNGFDLVEMKWYQDLRYNKNLEWYRKNKETGVIEIQKEPTIDSNGNIKYDNDHWDEMIREGWKPRSPWYLDMCGKFNNDEVKIAQELDVSFLGSASNVVDPEFIEMQEQLNVREPLPKDDDGDMFHLEDTLIWKKPVPGHRYICSCLPEGELVKTINGNKQIEKVLPTDILYNISGTTEKIVECKRRFVTNEDIYCFYVSNIHKPLKFTKNHPILNSNGLLKRWYSKTDNEKYKFGEYYYDQNFDFINACNISEESWIKMPNIYKNKVVSDEDILKYCEKYCLGDSVLTPDFWWYCGMWVAEGSGDLKNGRIYTSHNTNEVDIHIKISNIVTNIFKRKINYSDHKINKARNLFFNHKNLLLFLFDTFGHGAKNKFISEIVKCLPFKYKKEFIKGYSLGDGSLCHSKREGLLFKFGSVSYTLLEDLQEILFGLEMLPCISLGKKEHDGYIQNRPIKCSEIYELALFKNDTKKFLNIIFDCNEEIKERRRIGCYFDGDFILFKIKKINVEKYTGYVYNFETETHSFCTNHCITHNCDCSRGDSEDRSALEITDIDGIDENGLPCIEQVLEYNGKITGDDLGEIAYWYGMLYNEAFMVVEAIGGYGDATILALMNLGYKNLYFDDPNLKTYTIQREASSLQLTNDGRLPGFHSSSVRFQLLTHFANMVRTNEYKIRSKRVIGELDTWIYKNGRPDHQDGCHDDTLTCLAMGMFVYKFHFNNLQQARERDAAFLQAWINSAKRIETKYKKQSSEISAAPTKSYMPIYSNKTVNKVGNTIIEAYRWLLK